MAPLSQLIKENEEGIRSRLHVGYAIWDDLVARVERQEVSPRRDFYDEQIWTFLVGCAYGLAKAGPDQLAAQLIGVETVLQRSKIWFETLPNSPRVKEGNSRVDLAVGAIKLRKGTQSGVEFDKDAGDWIALCECKWYSDIDTKVSYDQHRNQFLRIVENALFIQEAGVYPNRAHVVLITPASFRNRAIKSRLYQYKFEEYTSYPEKIIDELRACRLEPSQFYPEKMEERLRSLRLHWVTYQDLVDGSPASALREALLDFAEIGDCSHEHM
jgi:hypothetical protein